MITTIDFRILNLIQKKMRCSFLDFVMPKISMLGNFGIIWFLFALVFLTSNKYEYVGEKLICGLIIGALIGNLCLKNIFSRPRPFQIDTTKNLIINAPKDYSFPSGHTISSVIGAAILMNTDTYFGIGGLILCIMIIFSRMYLFVHFPSDILGGITLGILISLLIC